jgi:hypothetical protein
MQKDGVYLVASNYEKTISNYFFVNYTNKKSSQVE